MPYTPTVWVSTVTALDAAAMNNLETQYDEINADYIEDVSAAHGVGTANVWEDWDISGDVPVGTVAVQLICFRSSNGHINGARADGSGADHRFGLVGGVNERFIMTCGVPATRVIEVYDDDAGKNGTFTILGYWRK